MEKNSKIYIAGHTGLAGSAIKRHLKNLGFSNLIFRTSKELDLRNQEYTREFFEKEVPEYVFLTAAKVGGISDNINHPAEFIYDNLQIYSNVIHNSWRYGVKKLIFFASNCTYPKNTPQPMKEESLLTGKLEPTNEAFAVSKIAGIKMCKAYNKQYGAQFIPIVPASLFGPNDNFNPNQSHLVAALIKKFHEAKIDNKQEVVLWGTGEPRRENMYVNDIARAGIFLMKNYNLTDLINIGTGIDHSVKELAEILKEIVGFEGEIVFDSSKPNGMMRKLLDSSKINSLGWKPETELKEGLKKTYEWFQNNLR